MKVIKMEEVHLTEPLSLAIGFFDGLHLGHMSLINEVLKYKGETKTAVMSFDVHPLCVLKGEKRQSIITLEEKKELLEEMGIDYLLVIHFTKEVAALSPQVFIDEYLNKLPLKRLVCGYDFHFGDHNSGSIEDLKKQSFELIVKNAVMYNDTEKVSSTLIKKLMDQGMIEEVNTLLGRPYKVKGTVIHGKQRGRLIGFPTLNIDYGMKYLPKRGVYGTIVEINHQYYIGMANIGMNPTFNDINRLSLEVNVFDFDEDVYGKEVEVTFCLYKREETVFNGLEGLKTQLTEDRKYLSQVMKKYLTLFKNNVK